MEHLSPSDKGTACEYAVVARFLALGFDCYQPIGIRHYDLLIDRKQGLGLERVQIKKGRLRRGSIVANAYSSVYKKGGNGREDRKYQEDSFELYVIFCPETSKCYLIRSQEIQATRIYLRVGKLQKNQHIETKWASDYEI